MMNDASSNHNTDNEGDAAMLDPNHYTDADLTIERRVDDETELLLYIAAQPIGTIACIIQAASELAELGSIYDRLNAACDELIER